MYQKTSARSLLAHGHCLGNAGLQEYVFGIKKMAANDLGVRSEMSLLMENSNLFRWKIGFPPAPRAGPSACTRPTLPWAERPLASGLQSVAMASSVHHLPARGHTWAPGPRPSGAPSSQRGGCFPTRHCAFPQQLLGRSCTFAHCILLGLSSPPSVQCVPVLPAKVTHLCVFLVFP